MEEGAVTSQVRQIHQLREVLQRRWAPVSTWKPTLPTALRMGVLAQGTNRISHMSLLRANHKFTDYPNHKASNLCSQK